MIRMIFTLFLTFYAQVSFSKMMVTGEMCGKKESLASNVVAYFDLESKFPLKNYEVNPLFICNLQYHTDTPQSERKLDINSYKFIIADGRLDLVSQNENFYSYKLFIKTINASKTIQGKNFDYIKLKGNIIFPNNKDYLSIEGNFKTIEGKSQPLLKNRLDASHHYYAFTPIDKAFPHMMLTRLANFPVTVEFEME